MVERKDKVMVRKERMNMNYNMENIEYRLNQAERQEDEREKIGTSRKIMNMNYESKKFQPSNGYLLLTCDLRRFKHYTGDTEGR